MQIFVLNTSPQLSATDLCDKHIVKLTLETTQLLSTALWITGGEGPYKPTHKNHPCTIWAAKSKENWLWLYEHGLGLSSNYTKRYKKVHACEKLIREMLGKEKCLPNIPLTPFAQAMPDQYKNKDAVIAYRNYYKGEKAEIAIWKYSSKPTWW